MVRLVPLESDQWVPDMVLRPEMPPRPSPELLGLRDGSSGAQRGARGMVTDQSARNLGAPGHFTVAAPGPYRSCNAGSREEAANRSPGPSREGSHTAPLTSTTICDSEGLEPTGAPTEGLPSRLHTEFTMKEILPHGTLGLKSCLLMSVFLMFGSLGVSSESPHQIKKLT
ncbi:hypothetical protein STEG23_032811, partial [Scotinomys teguina]